MKIDLLTTTKGPIQEFIRRRNEVFDGEKVLQFSSSSSDRERFEIVYETLNKTRKSIPHPEVKRLERALELKNQGNDFFKKSQWLDAMKCYSLSYFNTPAENGK